MVNENELLEQSEDCGTTEMVIENELPQKDQDKEDEAEMMHEDELPKREEHDYSEETYAITDCDDSSHNKSDSFLGGVTADDEQGPKVTQQEDVNQEETLSEAAQDQETVRQQPTSTNISQERPLLPDDIMHIPMPTLGLRRHNGRPIRETLPGAQHVAGVVGFQDRHFHRISNAREAPNRVHLAEDLVENDTAVIDGAFLVTPDALVGLNATNGTPSGADIEQGSADNQEIIEGAIFQEKVSMSKRLSWVALFFLVVVVLMAIILIFVFVIGSQKDTPAFAGNMELEKNRKPITYPLFEENLPTITIKETKVIGSPLYLANKWLVLDPNFPSYSQARKYQRYVLAALYYATAGDNWYNNTNWLSYEVSECYWFSQTVLDELKDRPICNDAGRLTMVSLASNNLQGMLPDMRGFNSVPFLPDIVVFDIANNNVSGVTPVLYAGVPIEVVSISNNSFTELSPSTAFFGSAIRVLRADANKIQMVADGNAWHVLPKLEFYNVTDNLFEGILGHQISAAENLTYVGAGHTNFGGTVPTEIGLLSKLVELDLSGSAHMSGSLPTELGLLQNLQRVDIRESGLTGALPREFCFPNENQTKVEVLADCSQIICCG